MVKVSLTLHFRKPFSNNIIEIAPCTMYLTARTNLTVCGPPAIPMPSRPNRPSNGARWITAAHIPTAGRPR